MKSRPRSHYRPDRIVDAPLSPETGGPMSVADALTIGTEPTNRHDLATSRRIARTNARRLSGGAHPDDVTLQRQAATADVPEECPSCGSDVVPREVPGDCWALLVVDHQRYKEVDRFGVLYPCCSKLCRDVFLDPDPRLRVDRVLRRKFRRGAGRGHSSTQYAHPEVAKLKSGADKMTRAARLIRAEISDAPVFTFEEAREAIEENERLRQERDNLAAEVERLHQERDDGTQTVPAPVPPAFEHAAKSLFLRMIGETKTMTPFDDYMDNVVVEHDDEWTVPEGAEPWIAFLPKTYGGPFRPGESPVERDEESSLLVAAITGAAATDDSPTATATPEPEEAMR